MPWQMFIAALSAIIFRANLPLSISLVWISNPITMAPMWYFNYLIGSWLLDESARENLSFELTWHWISHTFIAIWQPLMLGSVVVGVALGAVGYLSIHIFWRIQVYISWRRRLHARKNKIIFKKPAKDKLF